MSTTQKHIQKIKADKLICNDEYKVFPQIICDGWGCAWKHTLISLCPPRSSFQDEVRYTRDLLREQPVKANEESFWGGWKNLQTMIQFFSLKKVGENEEKMIFESHAVLKMFCQGWQSPWAKIAMSPSTWTETVLLEVECDFFRTSEGLTGAMLACQCWDMHYAVICLILWREHHWPEHPQKCHWCQDSQVPESSYCYSPTLRNTCVLSRSPSHYLPLSRSAQYR